MYEASGTIKEIFEEQVFPSGFNKREFVVTTAHERYPQDLKFELVKDKCGLIEPFAVGQSVLVNFDIRGNEYNGRYFVNLAAWKIQAADGDAPGRAPAPAAARSAAAPAAASAATTTKEPDPSDLRDEDDFDDESIPF